MATEQDFINIYVEKLLSNIAELNKKLFLVETQLEINIKNSGEYMNELQELRGFFDEQNQKKLNDNSDLYNQLSEKTNKLNNLDIEKENIIDAIRSQHKDEINKILKDHENKIDHMNSEFEKVIVDKNNALHIVTLQLEELQKQQVALEQPLALATKRKKA